ncbi:hypothetical protein NAT51_17750 [Flavobacterium amniphilum]|uniref:hypothetical protein n=1 Tax=Flavobacterium amniphilum TaxID=1834035 RepID=UPI00202A3D8D|nr:hypothetical protein [Flavobacterium amniphilum]MCL9807376.1 hypothetical protein [Flavobacterium amniphilum]
MENIIEQLKKTIVSAPPVLNSSLNGVKNWKRAQFIILSEIISVNLAQSAFLQGNRKNELGTTISSATLQRIFTNDYSGYENPDLRFLKTLDKLAIFLGFSSLNHFLSHDGSIVVNEVPVNSEMKKEEEALSEFQELITNYCQEEFNSLLKLPEVDLGNLSDFIFDDGPLTQRIHDLISQISQLGYLLNSTNNRSNFELYGFKLCSLNETMAVVTVQEFWNLDFRDDDGNLRNIYSHVNMQTYFIKKQNGTWKIWDNHNPDYATIITDMARNMRRKTAALPKGVK